MKPSVDKLPDVAWARVERDVFACLDAEQAVERQTARPQSGVRWWWLALPMAASVIALVLVVVRGRDSGHPIDVEWSRVVAGAAPSTVTFDDADITLDADSAVVLQREPTKPLVWLERGAAWFSVASRASRAPFFVLAGETMVRVVGTRFRVARYGERTDVAVEHGTVEVQFRGQLTAVSGGQTWSSATDTPASASTLGSASTAEIPSTPQRAAPTSPALKVSKTTTDDDHDRVTYEALARLEPSQPDTAIRGYLELSREVRIDGPRSRCTRRDDLRPIAAMRGPRRCSPSTSSGSPPEPTPPTSSTSSIAYKERPDDEARLGRDLVSRRRRVQPQERRRVGRRQRNRRQQQPSMRRIRHVVHVQRHVLLRHVRSDGSLQREHDDVRVGGAVVHGEYRLLHRELHRESMLGHAVHERRRDVHARWPVLQRLVLGRNVRGAEHVVQD